MRLPLLILICILGIIPAYSLGTDHAGPENVLVVYNRSWKDTDDNGTSDSEDLAWYYAERRGIPQENVIGVRCTLGSDVSTTNNINYDVYFDSVLTPVYDKLQSFDGTVQYRDKIYYICLSMGFPYYLRTNNATMYNDPGNRSLDLFMVNIDENYAAGYTETGDSARPGGSITGQTSLSWANRVKAGDYLTFKEARDTDRGSYDYYLCTRLDGISLMNAKSLVDKAIYAERYLRNFAGQPDHPYYGCAVIDDDADFDAGHSYHAYGMYNWLNGTTDGSPYAAAPWDIKPDINGLEVGDHGRAPAVTGKIASMDEASSSVVLDLSKSYHIEYFKKGRTIQDRRGNSAVVESVIHATNTLVLDTLSGFAAGRTVYDYYGEDGVIADALFFYGFYEFKGHWDVFKFKVGATGFHMDSGSGLGIRSSTGTWGSKALRRNLTATSGAITEPFASGVPVGDSYVIALGYGLSFAEAIYNSVPAATRWMCTHVGDPLYAPFRTTGKPDDTTDPEFAYVTTRQGEADTVRHLRISLNGGTDDKNAEVAQFKIEFGTTAAYDSVIDFEWGWDDEPFLGEWEHEDKRHFFFAREYDWTISGLSANTEYHYRVTARDQWGNTASTGDMTFHTAALRDTGYDHTGVKDYQVVEENGLQRILMPNPLSFNDIPDGVVLYDRNGRQINSRKMIKTGVYFLSVGKQWVRLIITE